MVKERTWKWLNTTIGFSMTDPWSRTLGGQTVIWVLFVSDQAWDIMSSRDGCMSAETASVQLAVLIVKLLVCCLKFSGKKVRMPVTQTVEFYLFSNQSFGSKWYSILAKWRLPPTHILVGYWGHQPLPLLMGFPSSYSSISCDDHHLQVGYQMDCFTG